MNQIAELPDAPEQFTPNVKIEMRVGRFLVKTATCSRELIQAFTLRFQVFQIESIGVTATSGLDRDRFDLRADHLIIIDEKMDRVIATCRLNCSLFTADFYSEQEFECRSLIETPGTKLEVGRVCVHREFRKGTIIIMLWRAIADYMIKTNAKNLFGCGSVMTEDADEAYILYRYLIEEGKVRPQHGVFPTAQYRFEELERRLKTGDRTPLTHLERTFAKSLLPSLCRSYFEIGCYVPGPPAIDHDFKCIDFLTILESDQLNPKVRRKMFGN